MTWGGLLSVDSGICESHPIGNDRLPWTMSCKSHVNYKINSLIEMLIDDVLGIIDDMLITLIVQ